MDVSVSVTYVDYLRSQIIELTESKCPNSCGIQRAS